MYPSSARSNYSIVENLLAVWFRVVSYLTGYLLLAVSLHQPFRY